MLCCDKKTSIKPGEDLIIVTIDGQEDMIEATLRNRQCVVECKPDVGWYVANTVTRYFGNIQTGKHYLKIFLFPRLSFPSRI